MSKIFLFSYVNGQTNNKIKLLQPGDTLNEPVIMIDTTRIVTIHCPYYHNINGVSFSQTMLQFPNGVYTLLLKDYLHTFLLKDQLKENQLTNAEISVIQNKIREIKREFGIKMLKIVFLDNAPVPPGAKSSYSNSQDFVKWRETIVNTPPLSSTKDYLVSYYLFNEKMHSDVIKWAYKIGKECLIDTSGKVLFNKSSITSAKNKDNKILKGKLLTEKDKHSQPLINTEVYLINTQTKDSISKTTTDKFGNFNLQVATNQQPYQLFARPQSKDINVVILATQNGVEINRFTKTASGFTYKLIMPDITKLTEKEEEDISMTFGKFEKSANKNLSVTENILYQSDKFEIEKESQPILEKVFLILKNNPTIKLEIVSHTDSKGSDADNLKLSEKRANAVIDYLRLKGIDKNRLTALGKGETNIRNRCINDVECSDLEHAYNRRTEFNFKK